VRRPGAALARETQPQTSQAPFTLKIDFPACQAKSRAGALQSRCPIFCIVAIPPWMGHALTLLVFGPSIHSMSYQKDWPHAPVHRLDSHGVFMVTGATLHKAHLFSTNEKLSMLENNLLTLTKQYYWQLRRGPYLSIITISSPEVIPMHCRSMHY
jgi:hypothetical protein